NVLHVILVHPLAVAELPEAEHLGNQVINLLLVGQRNNGIGAPVVGDGWILLFLFVFLLRGSGERARQKSQRCKQSDQSAAEPAHTSTIHEIPSADDSADSIIRRGDSYCERDALSRFTKSR